MTNVTISLPEKVLSQARKQAMADNTSLNAVVREFLAQYSGRQQSMRDFERITAKVTSYARAGRKFTREELNQR